MKHIDCATTSTAPNDKNTASNSTKPNSSNARKHIKNITSSENPLRNLSCTRLVIKIGSSTLTGDASEEEIITRINDLSIAIAQLKQHIPEILIVSSGAIACGFRMLGFSKRPRDIIDKQACAAIGQARLLWHYEQAFQAQHLHIAQILLTKDDLTNKKRYLYASGTLRRLLELNIIPIINENDPVLANELRYIESFGDNDNLAALVANMINAQLLLILSDVNGLYSANPFINASATRISYVNDINAHILAQQHAAQATSALGTGGMLSKLHAAKKAIQAGCNVAIIKGEARNITRFFAGDDIGTFFPAYTHALKKRRFYISYVAIPKGALIIDDGARTALHNGKSLLPKGVLDVKGVFDIGDVISVYDALGHEIARGRARYNAKDCAHILGKDSKEIASILGQSYGDCLIHRDDLALL